MGKQKEDSGNHFPKPTEDTSTLLERLDFSQAFKKTALGTALCITNPMYQKFLDNSLHKVQREKKRRQVALYHNQRTFFITQVFEKGLNPYIHKGKDTKSQSARNHPQRKTIQSQGVTRPKTEKSKLREAFVKQDGTLQPNSHALVRSQTEPGIKQSKGKNWKYTTAPRSSEGSRHDFSNLDSSKDKTLPTIREGQKQATKQGIKPKANVLIVSSAKGVERRSPTKFPKLSEDDSEDMESLFSHAKSSVASPRPMSGNGEGSADQALLLKLPTPTRTRRKDIAYLRKNPEELFPKMNGLVLRHRNEDSVDFEDEKVKEQRDKSAVASATFGSSVKERTPRKVANTDEETAEGSIDYVKLIQRLTTYLPEHLVATAKQQIREMTQSDVIYEQKEQFKEDNKSRLRRSATIEDRRWSKLEGSLCRTHGVSRKWRQLCPAGPWVQVKDIH